MLGMQVTAVMQPLSRQAGGLESRAQAWGPVGP